MSERKINLEEILDGVKLENGATFSSYISKDGDIYRIVKIAMKKACCRILELAVENATINLIEYSKYGGKIITEKDLGQEITTEKPQIYLSCNKQSILDTIKQIE